MSIILMAREFYDLIKRKDERYEQFEYSVIEAIEKLDLERQGILDQKQGVIYGSKDEGGILVQTFEEGKDFRRGDKKVRLDGLVVFIGASDSLIKLVEKVLEKRV